jgi:hypothetical protein
MSEIPATERVRELSRTMLLIRAFDEHAGEARRAGKLRGSVHEYIGQEAIATGVCASLQRTDYISSYHRGHGHCLAKGADPDAMMKELYGRTGDVCSGKGGSMHVADFSLGGFGGEIVAEAAESLFDKLKAPPRRRAARARALFRAAGDAVSCGARRRCQRRERHHDVAPAASMLMRAYRQCRHYLPAARLERSSLVQAAQNANDPGSPGS